MAPTAYTSYVLDSHYKAIITVIFILFLFIVLILQHMQSNNNNRVIR